MSNCITKHVPNTLTCCNLISGCIATMMAFNGEIKLALVWIIIGVCFDFVDGMSARLLNVASPIGKELDSLADCVTSGVAPSTIILYELSIIDYPSILASSDVVTSFSAYNIIPYFAYIMAAFSALRLAKFNLDTRQTTSFVGMPTPANALFWASLVVYNPSWLEECRGALLIILVMMLVSCYLLVSEIPMFALKFKHWGLKGNEIRYGFILLSAILLAIFGILKGLWIVIACYILISFGLFITGKTSVSSKDIVK